MRLVNRFIASLLTLAIVAPALAAGPAPGPAIDRKVREHPGFIDGSGFVELADEDGQLIEVTLGPKLLNLFTSRAKRRQESTIAEILRPLIGMNAIVAEVSENRREVSRKIDRIVDSLEERDGWERFVRVREGGTDEDYQAFVHGTKDDQVDGLLVIGFTGDDQLIFVNLVGTVDMERIFILGEKMGLPGLEDLPSASEVERRRRRDDGDGDGRIF